MKKSLIILMGLTALNSSYANLSTTTQTRLAPQMRGEITAHVVNPQAVNLLHTSVAGVPAIATNISNVQTVKTVLIPADSMNSKELDVTLLDDFIDDVSPNARHYPPNFPNATSEYITSENVKYLSDWLEPYAAAPNASFDVVLRAAKINGMARNLNVGTNYTLRANTHMAKAVKMQPNHAEANFLYGMMISEAGGFNEGKKYLDKAVSLGYVEAEQSLAQSDLLTDKTASAKSRLQALQTKHPNNAQIAEQLRIVENGGYYIWKIADKDISVKPIQ